MFEVETLTSQSAREWDDFVRSHPDGSLYHLSVWKDIICKTYRHPPYYLVAYRNEKAVKVESTDNERPPGNAAGKRIAGLLPLVHIDSNLFGKALFSIPFFDMGGVLSDDKDCALALIEKAMNIGRRQNIEWIEFRHQRPLLSEEEFSESNERIEVEARVETHAHKVRMVLELPASSKELKASFKSKLRSQIRRAMKADLRSEIGGIELLTDFYRVFAINMRDLGSPVHSRKIMQFTLETFHQDARVVMVYHGNTPVAGAIIIGFGETMENPWASSLRRFSRMSPNMLLYWKMFEYACEKGYRRFDLGRSSPEEGTFKFKEQWGAKPIPLHWQYITMDRHTKITTDAGNKRFNLAIEVWKRMPVFMTNFFGPKIRKYIGL